MIEELARSVDESVNAIKQAIQPPYPALCIMLGSGLGNFADEIENPRSVNYADLAAFSQATVSGHAGKLIFGTIEGVPLICMQGRVHYYEGHPPEKMLVPVRTLRALGVETLILTNAAGSLRAEVPPASLMLIEDHINFANVNPLIGLNDDSVGPRFPDMSDAYDPELRHVMEQAADDVGVTLHTGIYLMTTGPSFETPAEIRAYRVLGADAVGMSTVPECIAANHCGMRVAGLSVITNLAAGMEEGGLGHDETLLNAERAYDDFARLMKTFLKAL